MGKSETERDIYLYSDNHVLWAWNTKAVPMNYLDVKAVPQ